MDKQYYDSHFDLFVPLDGCQIISNCTAAQFHWKCARSPNDTEESRSPTVLLPTKNTNRYVTSGFNPKATKPMSSSAA